MTLTSPCKIRKAAPIRIGVLSTALLSFFCIFLLFKNPEAAIEYVTRGLHIATGTVIPALFPFMVLSELIVSGALGNVCFFLRPLCRLLHLSTVGGCSYLLGILCGAPIGARCLVAAYRQGSIEKRECEYLLGLSTIPSSAFLINAVGVLLWESSRLGLILFLCPLLSSLLLTLLIFGRAKANTSHTSSFSLCRRERGATLFASAIKECTSALLSVTAYVVFFSVVTGTLELILRPLSLPPSFRAYLSSLLEISDGMSRISALEHTKPAAMLCAFAAGWGGLSVHCQVLSVCDGSGLSLRPYFILKAGTALLSTIVMFLLLILFPL